MIMADIIAELLRLFLAFDYLAHYEVLIFALIEACKEIHGNFNQICRNMTLRLSDSIQQLFWIF